MNIPLTRRRALAAFAAASVTLAAAACSSSDEKTTTADGKTLTKIQVALDWTPNTNHTGLYVAAAKGYFANHGLDVEIVQPGDADPSALVAADKIPFAISAQESLTQARAEGAPLVSIAAIIQHNTSGFASPKDRNLTSPKQYAGKTYGGWGGPLEEPLLKAVVSKDGGDASKIKTVNVGDADFFAATKKGIDFEWIFYGWTGIEAELRGEPVNIQYVKDYDPALDFYTPILITNEKQIANNSAVVKEFTAAVSEGYGYAAKNASESADILLKAAPDLDAELVKKSQEWLSPRYQDDAARWGEQKPEIWTNFSAWLLDQKVLSKEVDASKAYTNDFLPAA
ncbi:ABC-type nitrate/sulfonate/bicarbonate transport system substrate-binding protein [Actinoplanes lutulentus]|uniref:ABC-type nitrate/sulfonate/bicarbonate transport system substrate-binding protein n=1 Tax=Actinoplanes lutulentus TaxID=1287878 RepID=A0A327ZJH8_9ACTN|nr:ABC transporter substrate-binding protein [Actinoplanes lutulentus]MBB2941336.1 ABC-type nitrate/sulfonate/bicarbonate transport system substrate-binding protein [Actinoplanes lutulentus]RAK36828.1 ABC-type nitrate/sulfonate/bicarbonate transport system substrate-binding protein [Actinoplanes lutulentus]